MAQTTIPTYLTGKVGTIVYTPNRQGTAVRTLVTPRNPKSAAQESQRGVFTNVTQSWRGLLQSQRNSWANLVSSFKNNLSPFNIYCKVNLMLEKLGAADVATAPAMPTFAQLSFGSGQPTAVVAAGA